MKEKLREHKNIYLCFFILCFLFYGNTLKNKYSLDDDYVTSTNFPIKGQQYIPNNKLIQYGFKSIPKIWVSRYAHDSEFAFDYRPVVTTTFAIEFGIFGQNPFISHLINVLLYFLLICIIFDLLLEIFKGQKQKFILSFLTALLFLIHPLHTEVVASLKSRDEILAFIFSLLAVKNLLFFTEKPSIKTISIIVLFLFLGFFSKLSAVLVMFSIPLILLFYRKTGVKQLVFISLGLYILYMAFQEFTNYMPAEESIRHFYHFENPLSNEHITIYQKIIIAIKTYGFYTQLLFFPYPLRFYYGANMFDLSANINNYFIIGLMFIIVCSIYYFKKRDKDFLFSFLWMGLLLLPFLNFITPVAGILGDRLTFMSSLAFCLLISNLVKHLFSSYHYTKLNSLFNKPMVYVTPLIFISMIYVINRNSNWYNKLTLFEHDMPYLENSAKANSLMANEYFEMMRQPLTKYSGPELVKKALKHYSLAVKADSSIYTAYNNAGVVYFSYLKDIKKAKNYFRLAIRHKPDYPKALENLANCFKAENDLKKASFYYIESIKYNNKEYDAYLALVRMLFESKKYKQAYECAKIANKQILNDYHLIALEANCLLMMGQIKESLLKFEVAYSISNNKELAQFMSQKYLESGDTLNYIKYKNL